ncbi:MULTISPECIES: ferrochelatase [Proteus]|uniref:Ferrochelatase n=1 Tax=Proteus penneri TaxID=102862 RepID=A0ABS0W228_9GAMM|nr:MULTISPECIES: ferrochelatase [Proteus]MBJ2117333.1 ferrochelatase [Proteus penneri]MCO8051827.1 ferrochelatase [Proteus penneri]MCX2589158.1 ferrochelatase [Proteus penneri]NBL77782.1 ferrochelatase [Proteus sp. G2672]NBL89766.1 ferrochelatase [Proteus sp. G2673]
MNDAKYGVLLVNLGTPDAPTTGAVRRYLAQFLSDPRVVDVSPLIWKPILQGVILPFRSPKVAKLYQQIWMDEGSPLLVYSRAQQRAVAQRLSNIPVELGMCYGNPSLNEGVEKLLQQGVENIILLPLYPQYSCSTSAAVFDGVSRIFKDMRTIPSLHFIRSYPTHPLYIKALVTSIEKSFQQYGKPDRLILSFHGIPERFIKTGDIYYDECCLTTEKLKAQLEEQLGYPKEQVMLTFQSRFGREPWLSPYTDKTMEKLGSEGVEHVQVVCPGFSSDCLETLEEINEQNREFFIHGGGKQYEYIPALNAEPEHIDLLEAMIREVCKK